MGCNQIRVFTARMALVHTGEKEKGKEGQDVRGLTIKVLVARADSLLAWLESEKREE